MSQIPRHARSACKAEGGAFRGTAYRAALWAGLSRSPVDYIINLCRWRGRGAGCGGGGVAWAWPGRGQACTGPGKMAAMDTESAPLTLESLPTDPLLLILSFLDYRDLIK